jgi:hypothetical protein
LALLWLLCSYWLLSLFLGWLGFHPFLHLFFFWTVLEFELRASCLLSRRSNTWATPQLLLLLAAIITLPDVAGMTGMCHRTKLLVGLMNFLPMLALNLDPPDLHLPSGWDYRYEPLCLAKSCVFQFVLP